MIEKYGARWKTGDAINIEMECIRRGGQWTGKDGQLCGLGLVYHVIQFASMVWKHIKWHRWATDLMLPEFCRHGRVAVFGPSQSGKSFISAVFVLSIYFCQPHGTTVLVSSTTRDELELRIWGEIKKLFRIAKKRHDWLPGNLVDSRQMICTDSKDSEARDVRDGIIGRPCKRGGEWVGLSSFVGIKNDRIILVGDECHFMADGFLDSLANLTANPQCTAILLGNLNDLNSQLGQAAEPERGWDSIGDTDVSRVYPTRWANGRAIQLIGTDSPQLDFPEGKEPYGKLIGRRYLKECEQNYGLDSPLYNMFAAGRVPRGTMEQRVITKQICLRHSAFEPITWGHEKIVKLYAADISYNSGHGDRTVGRAFGFGKDNEGHWKFAPLTPPKVYGMYMASHTVEEEIARIMKSECEALGIPPENVFYDGTGRSSFTSAVMRHWSTKVNAVEFGGTATQRDNFLARKYEEDNGSRRKGDLLPCREVFGKFVTELWFAWTAIVEADQFRGLDEETAKEGYMRLWRLIPGNKMDVETKEDMKKRLRRSPDAADCLVVGIEGARRLGFPLGKLDQVSRPRNVRWIKELKEQFENSMATQELAYVA